MPSEEHMPDYPTSEDAKALGKWLGRFNDGIGYAKQVENDLVRHVYGDIELKFGKYKGMMLRQIPLEYLDRTISVMPPTLLIRNVQKYVEAVCIDHGIFGNVPNKSQRDLEQEASQRFDAYASGLKISPG